MKQEIHIYVTHRSASEQKVHGKQGVRAVHHNYDHPDVEIRIWKLHSVSMANKRDMVRHAVMVALQANGHSVSRLRDTGGKGDNVKGKNVPSKQMRLL